MGNSSSEVAQLSFTWLEKASISKVVETLDKDPQLIYKIDYLDRTMLHHACIYGLLDVVNLLLDRGADIHSLSLKTRASAGILWGQYGTTHSGITPLYLAAEKGHHKIVQVLVDRGAKSDVFRPDSEDILPFHVGCASGNESLVVLLYDIQQSGDIKIPVDVKTHWGRTPLYYAVTVGKLVVCQFLVNHGAVPIFSDTTCLHVAAEQGNELLTEFFISVQHGDLVLKLDKDANTPLHIACCGGHVAVVKLLLSVPGVYCINSDASSPLSLNTAKSNLMIENTLGRNILHSACLSEQPTVILRMLLRLQGANVHCRTKEGNTPLHELVCADKIQIEALSEAVAVLIDAGLDVNDTNNNKETVLHMCCRHQNDIPFTVISRYSGTVKITKTKTGASALHIAAAHHYDVLRNLLTISPFRDDFLKGLEDIDDNGRTPMACACSVPDAAKNVMFLVSLHANFNCSLGFASEEGSVLIYMGNVERSRATEENILHLISLGADIGQLDHYSNTILHLCFKNNLKEAACKLIEQGINTTQRNKSLKLAWENKDEQGIELVQKYLHVDGSLVYAKNCDGRNCVDVASGAVRDIIERATLWFGRYQIAQNGRPEHQSSSCMVFRAIDKDRVDSTAGKSHEVVLKLMRSKDHFIREIASRQVQFDDTFVINIYETHPSRPNVTSKNEQGIDSVQLENSVVVEKLPREGLFSSLFKRHVRIFPDLSNSSHDHVRAQATSVSSTCTTERDRMTAQMYDWLSFKPDVIVGKRAVGSNVITAATENEFVVSLSKLEAEEMFCAVMPAGERNLFVALKQERFAGNNFEEIRHIFNQMVAAVSHIHDRGILHGDIKTLNLVRIESQWKLIDFDASCVIGELMQCSKFSSGYIPPEGVHLHIESGTAVVKSIIYKSRFQASSNYDFELVVAHPSWDVWSLGCILYQLCNSNVQPLFHVNQEDNLSDQWNDEDSLWVLGDWNDATKQKKLSKVLDPSARNLLSVMLSKDPSKRPSLSRVLMHPFLSKKTIARLPEHAAAYDVFLSYRVSSDSVLMDGLFRDLTERGVRVWCDKHNLLSGVDWERGFCAGLVNSKIYVCLLSKNGINKVDDPRCNFSMLTDDSPCDNVLLELRFALELQSIGYVRRIFPVMIGDFDETTRTYANFFKCGATPKAPNIAVRSIEVALRKHMDAQALGTPLQENKTVSSVLQDILKHQGCFLEGEEATAMQNVLNNVVSMVQDENVVSDSSMVAQRYSVDSRDAELNHPNALSMAVTIKEQSIEIEKLKQLILLYEQRINQK